jgi:hypothetical protein
LMPVLDRHGTDPAQADLDLDRLSAEPLTV